VVPEKEVPEVKKSPLEIEERSAILPMRVGTIIPAKAPAAAIIPKAVPG